MVSLVILLLMTLLGISGMQTTILEEKMAGNFLAQNLIFQTAEAVLREVEATIPNGANPYKTIDLSGFIPGTSNINIEDTPPYSVDLIWTDPSTDSSKIYATFEITTTADDANSGASIQLQSTYRQLVSFIL